MTLPKLFGTGHEGIPLLSKREEKNVELDGEDEQERDKREDEMIRGYGILWK
jgi:hypothetical protein